MWSPEGEPSETFLDALYGELQDSDEEYQEVEEEFMEDDMDVDYQPPRPRPVALVIRPSRPSEPTIISRPSPVPSRDRSRSPLRETDSRGVVIGIFDENGSPLDIVPDSQQGNGRGQSRRGRARGLRGGRRARGSGHRRQHAWHPGQHLEEIYMTDDVVPSELREMVGDVVRRRQRRQEADDVIFYDAIDDHFEWSPMDSFQSVEETFTPEHTGSVTSFTDPYDAFRSFWDESILQSIVDETNRYAGQIPSTKFQAGWYATNVHELLCLFAFWMMTGIIRMPTIGSYFAKSPLLKTEIFTRITSRTRYNNLNRALHFVDTSNLASDNACHDPMFRLNPIVRHLNAKFQSNYVMSKDICIDESLTLWKGRLHFKQYIRSKAAKFGIKTFELCESATGYLWSFFVYTGKDTGKDNSPDVAKGTTVVQKLIHPLLNKGYRLFMDNWFNSPWLARFLKRNGTDCVGTLRASRVDVPKLVTHAPLKQGQFVARHSGDVCVLSWLDKKRVNMISTCHGSATGLPHVSSQKSARPVQFKPQSVLDYNRCMGGVDLKDQMLEPYLLERKRCSKWYLKLFKRLLNCSIHNARILLQSSLKARQDNLNFRLQLVHGILSRHHSLIPKGRRADSVCSRVGVAHVPHLMLHKHWPVRISQTEKDRAKNSQSRKRCVVCHREKKKEQKTPFQCEECGVPLCVENCFKIYHTVP